MEPKKVYRSLREEVPEEEYLIPLGQSRNRHVKDPSITLITSGRYAPTYLASCYAYGKQGNSKRRL